MEVIKKYDKDVIKRYTNFYDLNLKHNQSAGTVKSIYCIEKTIESVKLIYNVLTCELIALDLAEMQLFYQSDYAMEHLYTVGSGCDQYSTVKELKKSYSDCKESLSKYVILTTTDCNARCYYCFEKGHQDCSYVTTKTAEEVADFICSSTPDNEIIHLSWFGGEPLLNAKAIDVICDRCSISGRKFYSSMITNGILLDEIFLQKASIEWNLKWIQITIDGTENLYNQTKNYVNISGNPYCIVLENIKSLISKGIHVLVSLRVSDKNGESLCDLVEDLALKFGQSQFFSVMCTAIHEKAAGKECRRNDITERNVRQFQRRIMKRSFELGIYTPKLSNAFRAHHCNSDSGKEIVVLPNGRIGWCNNYLDTNYIGDIKT